ncbi:hypothetical protein PENARI_c028G12033 [Penicillium arizonense]|uniref:Uncharacterized protein n=1 Tax=Penicillium arizonense TaxID=1835702 RepID=A0A1F5L5H6_PENAI|nr:hypothetical protein PENARI_c028G12033 [Penicillium arizonense]OGE48465.1 hypothetical protein PENARI_c028G12033 [Penicillium arizonense]
MTSGEAAYPVCVTWASGGAPMDSPGTLFLWRVDPIANTGCIDIKVGSWRACEESAAIEASDISWTRSMPNTLKGPHLRAAASDNHETRAQWRSGQMPIPVQETLPPRGRGARSLAYYEPREPKTNDNVSALWIRMELKPLMKA